MKELTLLHLQLPCLFNAPLPHDNRYLCCKMMEEKTRTENITMVNVYQVAADIGNDFEHLIEKFGSDGFRDIMPKIIKSLECLEEAVKLIDKQQENLSNLEEQVMKLEQESATKEEEKLKLIQVRHGIQQKKKNIMPATNFSFFKMCRVVPQERLGVQILSPL